MSGPARAGLFIYANDAERVARFYESVATMTRLHENNGLIVLQSSDIQLLVYKLPEQITANIAISSPPTKRMDTALKFFFTVPNLSDARQIATDLGGDIFNENWQGPGFIVCNAIDPEGNVFQVRESIE